MSSTAIMARPNALRRSGSWRLPVWGPPLLLLLAGVIGLLFAVPVGNIGLPYLIAFSAAAIAGIILVVPRGLFVTVAQLPLLFTILTPIVAWFTASLADPAVGGALDTTPRRTRVITAAYPIIQYFPWIAAVTLIALAIAVWRYLEVTRRNAKVEKTTRKEKRKLQRAEESTTTSATKARRRVAESDARRSRHGADATGTRPAADIIRDAEERRKRLAERSRRRQAGTAAAAGAGAAAGPRAGSTPP
ncbi:DUF6542 domain-containing protein, partial [uncultured Corynebacterium sp.]|uniref:DUF6542 domain-containing protein n=1 Tax=uncultured Corynebacterium sp. TaxID=159447 RepID=UPI00345C3E3A